MPNVVDNGGSGGGDSDDSDGGDTRDMPTKRDQQREMDDAVRERRGGRVTPADTGGASNQPRSSGARPTPGGKEPTTTSGTATEEGETDASDAPTGESREEVGVVRDHDENANTREIDPVEQRASAAGRSGTGRVPGAPTRDDLIRQRIAAQNEDVDADDIENVRQRIAAQNEDVDADDIENVRQTGPGEYEATIDRPDRQDLSPIARMSVPEDRIEDAVAGEQEIERQAKTGDTAAQVFEAGVDVQEFGAETVRPGVKDATKTGQETLAEADALGYVPLTAPIQQGAEAQDAQVPIVDRELSEATSSAAGGLAEFPVLLGGSAVSAGASGAMAAEDAFEGEFDAQQATSDFQATTETAVRTQGEFIKNRPVEAALVFGPPVVGSGRAAVRGRTGGRGARSGRTSEGRPGVTESRTRTTKFKQEVQRLVDDQTAQVGKQRSRQQRGGGESRVDARNPELDPRVFERNRGRGPGRSEGIDAEVGGRPARRGPGERGGFREQVQRSRQVPETDLRQAVPAESLPNPAAAQARTRPRAEVYTPVEEGVERVETAQQREVRVDDEVAGAREDTSVAQGDPAGDVVSGQVERVRAAQEPQVRLDDVLEAEAEDTSRVREDAAGRELDADVRQVERQAQRSLLDERVETGLDDRGRGRGDSSVDTGVDITPDTAVDTRADTRTDQRTTTVSTTPGDTVPDVPPPTTTPGRDTSRRIPGVDLPDLPSGREFDQGPDALGPLVEKEVFNPVAAPDELDDIAAEATGIPDDDAADEELYGGRLLDPGLGLDSFDDGLEDL